jgi:hypothetical protein
LWQPAVGEVAAVAVDLADCRDQIVKIGLGKAIDIIIFRAVLAAAFLPALTLVANFPRRDNVKCAL